MAKEVPDITPRKALLLSLCIDTQFSVFSIIIFLQLCCEFVDGDDCHPTSNKEKMRQGIPLEDTVCAIGPIYNTKMYYTGSAWRELRSI